LLHHVYYTEKWLALNDHAGILAQIEGNKQIVSNDVMASMSATETPPGVLAVVSIDPPPIPRPASMMLILDNITNPGNLGTMLRTAGAAGVEAVLLSPGCVDLYNPKVIRGGMGAHLRLPVHCLDWTEIAGLIAQMRVFVAAGDGTVSYTAVDWQQPSALIVGNEAHGVSRAVHGLVDEFISIPMMAGIESLNAAIAAAVILFEAVRQRKIVDSRLL